MDYLILEIFKYIYRQGALHMEEVRLNGGVFEKEVWVEDEYVKRYWITL